MGIYEDVKQRINFRSIYSGFLKDYLKKEEAGELVSLCPFHEDTDPSLRVNVETGLWKCFGACNTGGDVFQFVQRKYRINEKEALEFVASLVGIEIKKKKQDSRLKKEDVEKVEQAHARLMDSPKAIAALAGSRGLTVETIKKFKLGFIKDRYSIPVYNDAGDLVNVRLYKMDAKRSTDKMRSWAKGFGKARLFPLSSLEAKDILLTEGELDTLLAVQLGFNAVTVTSGAGTWIKAWSRLFKGKRVSICYDIDQAGKKGSLIVAKALQSVAKEVRILSLPIDPSEIPNGDLTDAVVNLGLGKADIEELIEKAPLFEPKKKKTAEADEQTYEVQLADASKAQYFRKKVQMECLISGKDSPPYIIPSKVSFSCSADPSAKNCSTCEISLNSNQVILELDRNDPNLLLLLKCSEAQQLGALKKIAGVPKRCGNLDCEILETTNIEIIRMIPQVDFSSEDDTPYAVADAYFNGHGIETNRPYIVYGKVVADPRNQASTFVLNEAKKTQDTIEQFTVDAEVKKSLKLFQVGAEQSIKEKVDEIYTDIEGRIGIFGRKDVFLAMDLAYHSISRFRAFGGKLHRGWIESLIIGDTRTGKTQCAKALIQHYRAGELIGAESTTFAGIVGGLQKLGDTYILNWGKMVLNNGRLIVIDETSGLSHHEIGKLTGVRSTGIAEVTKIRTEKAQARTRKIWISNPREKGMQLAGYNHGAEAIAELFGRLEDVSKLDLAVSCASGEVSLDLINQAPPSSEVQKYSSEACNIRVIWAWSRKPEHVQITEAAETAALFYSKLQGKKYHPSIPLVEGAEQRVKLMRVAVALAAMVVSTDESFEKVIVTADHVGFAYDCLEAFFSKDSLSYDEYSRKRREQEKLADTEWLDNKLDYQAVKDFLDIDLMAVRDLGDILSINDKDDLSKARQTLLKVRALRRAGSGYSQYRKTPAFITYLKDAKKRLEAEEEADRKEQEELDSGKIRYTDDDPNLDASFETEELE